MNQSSDRPGRYWIVWGFGENHRHGRYFNAAMRAAGFEPAASFEAADIIVAHSGGCFALPPAPDKLVILCQPAAAWQGSAWRIWYDKTKLEVKGHRARGMTRLWLWKISLNLGHLATHPYHTRHIVQLAKRYRLTLPAVQARRIAVIINKHDPWSSGITMQTLQAGAADGTYIGLDGTHDELWTYPQPIVDIIKGLYAA